MPSDDGPHPVYSRKEEAAQRGDDPPGSFGHDEPAGGDLDPNWKPNDSAQNAAEGFIKEFGRERRPHREDVYPYLLIRAYSPGDRGVRPTWPPLPSWESLDILLIDAAYTGPFTPAQLVLSPTAGRRYRVFVRVWNLGLLPGIGVHLRAWFVNPGFFGGNPSNPAYQPHQIGGAMVNLDDRTRPGAMQVVELDETWDIPSDLTGHECLMASVSCPLDAWSGVLDANNDRHVGQRNLQILVGSDDGKALLSGLGAMVTRTGTLEILHGGAAVRPLLKGVLGTARSEFGPVTRLRASAQKALRRGVPTGTAGTHLLTMFQTGRGWLVADSARVWTMALESGLVKERSTDGRDSGAHPFATPLTTRRLIEKMGSDRYGQLGVLLDADSGDALTEGMLRLWDARGLSASDLAAALAEGGPYPHLLRFEHSDPEQRDAGGYSVTIVG
ncbi:hypothetical protein ACPPVW_04595 [Leifsonia sp. McL0607]|uniref:hypothetical protein n=1 Tax=Leifsonia sp. McL0607 TaxID=3415672 RepID=UPI003CEE77E9